MAGYRPKSLNELNEMYDKTITAEKAILKASKILEAETHQPTVKSEISAEENNGENLSAVKSLSDEVDSLINNFNAQSAKIQPPQKAAAPEKISFEKTPAAPQKKEEPARETPEEKLVDEVFSESKTKTVYTISTPEETKEKAMAKSDERTELFDDYMKIMNDDDDDFFVKRESFGKKKKKRKKGFFFHSSERKAEPHDEEEDAAMSEENSEVFSQHEVSEPPVVAFEPDFPLVKGVIDSAASDSESEDSEPAASFFSYDEEENNNEEIYEEPDSAESEDAEALEEAQNIFAAELEEPENDELPVPQELENRTYDEYMSESENDIYSFDRTKANTLPSYAQVEYTPESNEDEYAEEDYTEEDYESSEYTKKKGKSIGLVIGRAFLSILLVILSLSSAFTIAVNVFLEVDTGKLFGEDKYIFTADRDYVNAGIVKDDLVITEKRYADTGESFAYINYTQQCFMFGKMSGSIINDEGDVLFIAENNGERMLVLRDDTKGVVLDVYPSVGKIFRLCTENFIIIISVLLIACLIIILLLALVLKDKEKAQQKMIKKMVRKGIITDEETAEELICDEEEESDDLFSTIE